MWKLWSLLFVPIVHETKIEIQQLSEIQNPGFVCLKTLDKYPVEMTLQYVNLLLLTAATLSPSILKTKNIAISYCLHGTCIVTGRICKGRYIFVI